MRFSFTEIAPATGSYPPIPVIWIAAIVRYKVPFHIHRVSQLILHLATGLRGLSDLVGEVLFVRRRKNGSVELNSL